MASGDNPAIPGVFFQAPLEFLDETSPFPSPLPSGTYHQQEVHHSKAPVPKLDLSKAKQIQEQYAKKLTQPQQQNYNNVYNADAMSKVKQLEEELELTRKRLSHEMINNRLACEELSKVQKQLMQVVSTNELLVKSNKRYEEKWQKIFYTLEFYKDFYHKYIDLITKGQTFHGKSASVCTPKFPRIPKMNGKNFPALESDPDRLIKEFRRNQEENGKQVSVSILEAQEEEETPEGSVGEKEKRSSSNVFRFTKDQCKVYLLNLAKDLYVNSNFQKSSVSKKMLEKLKFPQHDFAPRSVYKLKRSLSNPLEYVFERKEMIFEVQEKNVMKSKPQQREIRIVDGQEEFVSENFDGSEEADKIDNIERKNEKATKAGRPGDMADEMISFTVDPDEFNKNKMVEVSFISNNDILDQIKNN